MPHLIVDYSANLAARCDLSAVRDVLYEAAIESGIFPLGGIRVRFHEAQLYALADLHPDNAYLSLVIRLGAGRSYSVKRAAGESIFEALKDYFADELAGGYFMLSVDMVENNSNLSFKANGVHARLK